MPINPNNPEANLPGQECGYDQIAATVNVLSTTEATGTVIIACGTHLFDGAPVIAEFYSPAVALPTAAAGNFVIVCLFEGATELFRMVELYTPAVTAQELKTGYGRVRFTPTSGPHLYSVTAFAASATGTPSVGAGAGGTSALSPTFVRFTKV